MKVTDRNHTRVAGPFGVRRLRRAAMLALGCLAAGAAHASVGAVAGAEQTLHGLQTFFADPANVRGLFGAAAGAVAAVLAARPFGRARRPDSAARPTDDR